MLCCIEFTVCLSNQSLNIFVHVIFLSSLRRLEELQSQLAEEKEKAATLNEQLQHQQTHKEQDLKQAREEHQCQISSLQEKIANLVSIIRQSYKMVIENYLPGILPLTACQLIGPVL